MIYLPPFLTTKYKTMKKIILTSLLFSLAALVNATPTGITLTGNHIIDENRAIGTTIGALSSGSGAATYTLKATSFSFDVGEQGGSSSGSNQFKVRPAGNSNGDNDIIIANISYNDSSQSPASSLVAAINALTITTGVSATGINYSNSNGQVTLTDWPANLNGATLIGFTLKDSSGLNNIATITIDPDLTIPLTLSTTLDEQYFAISNSGSDLVSAVIFDWETKSTYSIVVIATDSTGSYSQSFAIDINDIDESLSLSPTTVVENNAVGTTVGILATAGGTEPYTYTIEKNYKTFTFNVGEVDTDAVANNTFIVRTTNETEINIAGNNFEYYAHVDIVEEAKPALRLATIINEHLEFSAEATVNNSSTGTVLLTYWDDKYDGAELIGFSPTVNGVAIDHITITSANKTLPSLPFSIEDGKLITTAILDKATQGSYTITISSTDANDIVISKDFIITVTEGPSGTVTGITLAPNTINNQAADGATVGLLSTNATDTGRVYVLENNTATFSISGDKLTANNPGSLTASATYTVRISTLNIDNTIFTQSLTITVTNETTFSLDVDGNQTLNATNDGLIIFKYLLNPDANNLHTTIANDAIEDRKTSAQLKAYLDDAGTILDVDGNQTLNATNDGLIIFKYLLNPDANNLHTTIANDAIDDRNSTEDLKAYLDLYTDK